MNYLYTASRIQTVMICILSLLTDDPPSVHRRGIVNFYNLMMIITGKYLYRVAGHKAMPAFAIITNVKISTPEMYEDAVFQFAGKNPGVDRSRRTGSTGHCFARAALPDTEANLTWADDFDVL